MKGHRAGGKYGGHRLPLLAALALSACTQQSPGGASLQVQGASEARYLVVFKSETLPANAPTWAEGSLGARVLRVLEPIGTLVVLADPGTASRLAKHPEVLAVGREGRYTLPRTERLLGGPRTPWAPPRPRIPFTATSGT
ncbi:MAG: hypothetical protein ABDH20_07070 [Thermus sp.]